MAKPKDRDNELRPGTRSSAPPGATRFQVAQEVPAGHRNRMVREHSEEHSTEEVNSEGSS